jgi:hypothetical protein
MKTAMNKASEFASLLHDRSSESVFFAAVKLAPDKLSHFLRDRRNRKWIWLAVIALAFTRSYFVRELIVVLFFFTIFYIFLTILVMFYVVTVDAMDYGSNSVESLGRAFLLSVRHRFASPVQVPSLPKDHVVHRIRKFGHN